MPPKDAMEVEEEGKVLPKIKADDDPDNEGDTRTYTDTQNEEGERDGVFYSKQKERTEGEKED